MEDVGLFYGPLVFFYCQWVYFSPFSYVVAKKSGNPGFSKFFALSLRLTPISYFKKIFQPSIAVSVLGKLIKQPHCLVKKTNNRSVINREQFSLFGVVEIFPLWHVHMYVVLFI
jgi:hypothetical protein